MTDPSRSEIWKMFDEISPTYDRVNRIMTGGCDARWRKKIARFLPKKEKIHLLDCATGTGDQLFALLSQNSDIEKAVGLDLSKEMLAIAKEKQQRLETKADLSFIEASLLDLPFPDESFDCITISFGIRNVTDVPRALHECIRVLKPEGRLLILEGTIPANRLLKPFFLFYLRYLLPWIGGVVSKNKSAYRYLNQTMETFPSGDSFCALLKDAGFVCAKAHPFTAGAATLYQADKASAFVLSSDQYDQCIVDIEKLDLLDWLSEQPLYPKVYWRDRDTQTEHAALGSILTSSAAPLFPKDFKGDARFYGGMHFPSAKREATWEGFEPCSFWLPAFEIVQKQGSTQLIIRKMNEKASPDALKALRFEKPRTKKQRPSLLLKREDSLSLAAWKEKIAQLQTQFKEGSLQKVVLARKTVLSFSEPLSPWTILKRLKTRAQGATLFAFQLDPEKTFLGASPETFLHRQGRTLSIDALAATRKLCETAEHEFEANFKEKSEFNYVKEFIHKAITPFAQTLNWLPEETIHKTAHLQHLYNRATLELKNDVSDSDLITALHPTPAVGGYCREEALASIEDLESFQRGWYSAPVGFISPEKTHLVVALRCGLVQANTLHLFAGAGIVSESIAEKEWEEIDWKMKLLLYESIPRSRLEE